MFNFLVPGCPLQIYSKQRRERSDKTSKSLEDVSTIDTGGRSEDQEVAAAGGSLVVGGK